MKLLYFQMVLFFSILYFSCAKKKKEDVTPVVIQTTSTTSPKPNSLLKKWRVTQMIYPVTGQILATPNLLYTFAQDGKLTLTSNDTTSTTYCYVQDSDTIRVRFCEINNKIFKYAVLELNDTLLHFKEYSFISTTFDSTRVLFEYKLKPVN